MNARSIEERSLTFEELIALADQEIRAEREQRKLLASPDPTATNLLFAELY